VTGRLAAVCAALAAALLGVGCPRKDPAQGQWVLPSLQKKAAQEKPGTPDPPPVGEDELKAAPKSQKEDVDEFYVRILSRPTRDVLRQRPVVVQNASMLLLGSARAREKAHNLLRDLPLATAFFLLPAVKDLAKEKGLDPYKSEDTAMEVIFEIQQKFLRGGSLLRLFEYFAAVTGKALLVERPLLERKDTFDIRNVYPLPALSRVGDHLGLEDDLWRGIDRGADTLELSTRVKFNLRIHGEDVTWLLESIGRVGGLTVHVEENVKAKVTMRVRCQTGEEVIRQIARRANLKVKKIGKSFWITKS
jgi:hypothetical protein